jgi:hypothetical protein
LTQRRRDLQQAICLRKARHSLKKSRKTGFKEASVFCKKLAYKHLH